MGISFLLIHPYNRIFILRTGYILGRNLSLWKTDTEYSTTLWMFSDINCSTIPGNDYFTARQSNAKSCSTGIFSIIKSFKQSWQILPFKARTVITNGNLTIQ